MRSLVLSCSLIISSILLSVDVSGQCLSDQQSLLLQLNKSLIFNTTASEFRFLEWNPTTDCCTWTGVTCHEGRVIGLDLSNKNIVGGIDNSSLFNLQYLRSLDLSLNNFSTPIPPSFGALANLRHLNLSYAGFMEQIPIDLSSMTSLVTLDLSSRISLDLFDLLGFLIQPNRLKLENPNLLMLIQNLAKLEELHLDGVNMSASGNEWCQALSSSLPNLRVLSLSRCSLSGPIDVSLVKLQSLSTIVLDYNNLATLVPGFLANLTSLTLLQLSNCELHGVFPQAIFQVPTLKSIDFSFNKLLQGSLPEFSQNNSFRKLVLSGTSFSGRLPTSINNLKKLSDLDLYYCQFNGTLPNFMMPQLVYLGLSYNKFTGPIPSFGMARNLNEIRLSNNSLTGAITLARWEGLLKLAVVDLRRNSFDGSIPSSLFALPSLELIFLSNNKFNRLLPEFPNPHSSILVYLYLSDNNLEGPIPVSIFKLRKLQCLDLSFNKLNSTIQPDMIQGLTSLQYLDLSHNNLSMNALGTNWSSFPKNLTILGLASCKLTKFPNLMNLSELVDLDLSDNQIHGEVPNWIWKLGNGLETLNLSLNYLVGIQEPYSLPPTLRTLDLHMNQIRGKIPIIPKSADYIDFSSNYFNSSIPTNIVDFLTSGYFFSLSDNSLTGFIPNSMCNITSPYVLDLSNNGFSGKIPSCISELYRNVDVLDLSGNNFSGPIPGNFSVNCGLKTLDLNGNSMEGKIPKSLSHCNELEVLDLGNNNLIGEFPCFLKTISTLHVLVLRSNRFHGSINCSNTIETWEKLQIIDLSRNNFSGEIPSGSLAKWNGMKMDEKDSNKSTLDPLQVYVLEYMYYRDSVTVTSKGLELSLVKILSIYTAIDFSSNNFNGAIPEEIGELTLLYILNLSNNAFTDSIPSALGKLQHLESLDLSRNKLGGAIPTSLANLNFLSYLNLSFNELVGRIPSGSQLQTFSADSFMGNEELCGSPLINCTDTGSPDVSEHGSSTSKRKVDWDLLSAEIGFIVGFGIVVGPLLFCRRWRKSYFETVEDVAFKVLPSAVTRKLLQWGISG